MMEFYSFGIPSKSIAVETKASEAKYDLIAFLATAQASNIDFLPITWNPTLEGLGAGRTGNVHEAYVNLRASLAFKRVARSWLRNSSESDVFKALLSEVHVLGQPSIRQYPNIITLEGVCWDFVPETAKAWPVLVFEKTELGNLEKFAKSGNAFSWSQRIDLCADIGSALDLMHRHRECIREHEVFLCLQSLRCYPWRHKTTKCSHFSKWGL
jgi:serine/threonine protein kinase